MKCNQYILFSFTWVIKIVYLCNELENWEKDTPSKMEDCVRINSWTPIHHHRENRRKPLFKSFDIQHRKQWNGRHLYMFVYCYLFRWILAGTKNSKWGQIPVLWMTCTVVMRLLLSFLPHVAGYNILGHQCIYDKDMCRADWLKHWDNIKRISSIVQKTLGIIITCLKIRENLLTIYSYSNIISNAFLY